jgi:hypothetical protein
LSVKGALQALSRAPYTRRRSAAPPSDFAKGSINIDSEQIPLDLVHGERIIPFSSRGAVHGNIWYRSLADFWDRFHRVDGPGLEDYVKSRLPWGVVVDRARPDRGLRRGMGIRFHEMADRNTGGEARTVQLTAGFFRVQSRSCAGRHPLSIRLQNKLLVYRDWYGLTDRRALLRERVKNPWQR